MANQLDGPYLKLRRAESEVHRLAFAEDAFRQNANYRAVRAEFNRKTGKYVYRVRIGSEPNPDWGVYIGEIAHNLRSALDGLVYGLTKTPTDNTAFPIVLYGRTDRKEIRHRRVVRVQRFWRGKLRNQAPPSLDGVSKPYQTMIEGMQPYKRRQPVRGLGRSSVLWMLHQLNIVDKHRLIPVVGAKKGFNVILPEGLHMISEVTGPRQVILKEGAKSSEESPDMDMEIQIPPFIAFGDGCDAVTNRAVVFTLDMMAMRVRRILDDFASALK